MNNEIVEEKQLTLTTEEQIKSLAVIDEETIDQFLFGSTTTLTDAHKTLFKKTAIMFQLNPFKREIYAVPYKDYKGVVNMSLITGYEVYLKRAERSGKLTGWECWTEGKISDKTLKARIKIHRKDWTEPLKHEVFYIEYVQEYQGKPTKMWASKPVTMIKKVCMAQGFRLAFPDELGGIPYTSDELPDEMTTQKNITPQETIDPATDEVDNEMTEMNNAVIKDTKSYQKDNDKKETNKSFLIRQIQWLMDEKLNMGMSEFKEKVKNIDSFGTQSDMDIVEIRDRLWMKHKHGITIKKIKVEEPKKEKKDE